eukprot:1740433-Rhodomonas_salina.1
MGQGSVPFPPMLLCSMWYAPMLFVVLQPVLAPYSTTSYGPMLVVAWSYAVCGTEAGYAGTRWLKGSLRNLRQGNLQGVVLSVQ